MSADQHVPSIGSSKHDVEHHDITSNEKRHDGGVDAEHNFEVESEELPPGYFTSPFFVGTFTGIGLGLMAGVAGFGFAAPILPIINNDIGPVSS